jgi:hypothetical protein
MEIIRYKNHVNVWLHVILFAMSFELFLATYNDPILFFSLCAVALLVHSFLQFRRIKISVDKNFIAVDFTIFKIPYRKFHTGFDTVVVSSSIFDPVVFYKGADKILEFVYEDDVVAPTVETGTIEIRHKNKVMSTDNTKTSYTLFLKIKEVVLRQT